MMKGKGMKKWLALMIMVFGLSGSAFANEASVKKQLEERIPNLVVQSIQKAPVSGWYEVFAGDRVFYTDEKGDFIFVGAIVDTKTRRNLTEERIRDIMRVNFDALPFEDAIKIVKGKGERRLAVFEDPDCPFCKKLEADLAQLDNYTLYVFLYPIDQLHPAATEKSKRVWCAKDRAQAWLDLMLRNKPATGKGDCPNPITRNIELAGQLRISGTPAVIFEDGRMIPGAIPKERIEQFFKEASARKTTTTQGAAKP